MLHMMLVGTQLYKLSSSDVFLASAKKGTEKMLYMRLASRSFLSAVLQSAGQSKPALC